MASNSTYGNFTPQHSSSNNNSRTQYYDSPIRNREAGDRSRSDSVSLSMSSGSDRERHMADAVAAGELGGSYGPYAYQNSGMQSPGYSSTASSLAGSPRAARSSPFATPARSQFTKPLLSTGVRTAVWTKRDADLDRKLHDDDAPERISGFSSRGIVNLGALMILVFGLIALFCGYPIIQFYNQPKSSGSLALVKSVGSYNVGGINSTGQIPSIPGLPTLIDKDTPASAYGHTGRDGSPYSLMFSDEFNIDGRTFWPGDDPYWEAVDLKYWATGDYEWYDPAAVTTKGGNLVITMDETPLHGDSFRSGMLQSWNAFCFTGGYIEVSIQLPGSNSVSGFWPGAWTLGNLGRAGYGATTDGTWPYSYDTCDIGTLAGQTHVDGLGPPGALTGGANYAPNEPLSGLSGQKLSACSCPGSDHPGPNVGVGRGAPEIDIIEAQISFNSRTERFYGTVSQSAQIAPFNAGYMFKNTAPYTTVTNKAQTYLNDYLGGVYQQSISAVTTSSPTAYQLSGGGFATYGYENYPDPTHGYLAWYAGNQISWAIEAEAIGRDAEAEIGPRLLSVEPMSIILNLGMSSSFQAINWKDLIFPGIMLVDYVRVYQRTDSPNIGCDPTSRPTANYIAKHAAAYQNPNATTWAHAGFTFPKNSMTGC